MIRKIDEATLESTNAPQSATEEQSYPALPLNEVEGLAIEIVGAIAGVAPGRPSNIEDKDLRECVTASRIALCWHLASIRDSARRYNRLRGLRRSASRCAEAINHCGMAVIRTSVFNYRLRRLNRLDRHFEHGRATSPNQQPGAASQDDQRDMVVRCGHVTGPISLVMPVCTSIHCCELVDKLFHILDQRGPSLSEDEIELRAAACFAAMSWFIASLEGGLDAQLAIEEFEAIPKLIFTMIAVSCAEQQGIRVIEAAASVGDSTWIDSFPLEHPCFFWVGKDGTTRYSGPIEATQEMVEYCQTRDHLRDINHAIGGDFGDIDSETLSHFLDDPDFHMVESLTCRKQGTCFYWICFRT
jgi:hypothetical protein